MIPFYLVTGYLGSGKTTLLRNILDEYSSDRRIAIIQNEFAPSGTDGKDLLLTGNPFKLVEVNNGSVFCVCMLGTFIQSLSKLVDEYRPEMIVLEASGLSDPINIIELLQDESIRESIRLAKIVSIVDAPNYERGLKALPRFKHQVMVADTVIVNKKDIFTGDLAELNEKIRALNPFAEIMETSYCKLPGGFFLEDSQGHHPAAETFGQKESEGRPPMKAVVLRIHNKITRDALEGFIRHLQPGCVRIKGHVNLVQGQILAIQSVFDTIEIKELKNYTGPTEMVVFSGNITPGELRKTFLKFAEA